MEDNIKKEIDLLNFDIISNIHEKINYAKRLKNTFEKKKTKLHKAKLNDKANNIIEKISMLSHPLTQIEQLFFDMNKTKTC